MSETVKPKVIVIVGPTASGKTALAIELAKACSGEVISADSRQVYKRLDIGTEKVTATEMDGVPHHLIDIVDTDSVYSATDFKRDADIAIHDIAARGKTPIIAGGTFFYIDILLGRITSPEVPPNAALRTELETKTTDELYAQLHTLDPRRAADIDSDNPRRLMRAIEIATALGSVPEAAATECPYTVLTIGIAVDREAHKLTIKNRAGDALTRGLIAETHTLLTGTDPIPADRLFEIGLQYREVAAWIDTHHTDLPDLADSSTIDPVLIEQLTTRLGEVNWQYAKRQLMWLKRDETIVWFDRTDTEQITQQVQTFLG